MYYSLLVWQVWGNYIDFCISEHSRENKISYLEQNSFEKQYKCYRALLKSKSDFALDIPQPKYWDGFIGWIEIPKIICWSPNPIPVSVTLRE